MLTRKVKVCCNYAPDLPVVEMLGLGWVSSRDEADFIFDVITTHPSATWKTIRHRLLSAGVEALTFS